MLDPDPWKRWTASQAAMHPFINQNALQQRMHWQNDTDPTGNNFTWTPPWDPAICRRKLLNVQKTREKAILERGNNANSLSNSEPAPVIKQPHLNNNENSASPDVLVSHISALTGAMSLSQSMSARHKTYQDTALFEDTSMSSSNASNTHFTYATDGRSFTKSSQDRMGMVMNVAAPYCQSTEINRFMPEPATMLHKRRSAPHRGQSGCSSWIDPQYSQPAFVLSPSTHGVNYNGYDYSYNLPPTSGSHSFSGIYYDRNRNHVPIEPELAYALQRPGVVPCCNVNDHSVSMLQQQQIDAPHSYAHRQMYSQADAQGFQISDKINKRRGTDLTFRRHICAHEKSKMSREFGETDTKRSLLTEQLEEHAASSHHLSPHSSNGQYQESNIQTRINSYSDTHLDFQNQVPSARPDYSQQLLYTNSCSGHQDSHHIRPYNVASGMDPSISLSISTPNYIEYAKVLPAGQLGHTLPVQHVRYEGNNHQYNTFVVQEQLHPSLIPPRSGDYETGIHHDIPDMQPPKRPCYFGETI